MAKFIHSFNYNTRKKYIQRESILQNCNTTPQVADVEADQSLDSSTKLILDELNKMFIITAIITKYYFILIIPVRGVINISRENF